MPKGFGVPNTLLNWNEAKQKLFKHPSPGAENMHLWATKEPSTVELLLDTCDLRSLGKGQVPMVEPTGGRR